MAKKALVIRLGAIGDMVMITPVFRALKKDGYHVTVYCKKVGGKVLKHNPFYDKIQIHDDSVKHDELDEHLSTISVGYDKVVNLNGSIENSLLIAPYQEEHKWDKEKRHEKCNHNYIDRALEIAGYSNKGAIGDLYFSPVEKQWARDEMKKHKGKFVILWSLSGSSHHKSWPYAERAAKALLDAYEDTVIITVGDDICRLLEWEHERTVQRSGVWPLRKSMVMTAYADLVVGTETGILNAASCFQTSKVILLSHSTKENLTKHWPKCSSIEPEGVECYPCHKIHYELGTCMLDKETQTPICMTSLSPARVLNTIQDYYDQWRGYTSEGIQLEPSKGELWQ